MAKRTADAAKLLASLRSGDRAALARAITLLESQREADHAAAAALLEMALPFGGQAQRIGITGVPGVGKSTFIEALGMYLIEHGHRVAVIAIDPSSAISGGSILGDKSRMERLAQAERAFIRPSPSARTLGGVGRRTREAMLLCEAAGYDIVLVETVGVGQSETMVAEMVDCFLFLALPGAGDELQGIKRGILELADIVAVNKADGEQLALARSAAADFSAVLRFLRPRSESWRPRAMLVSALRNEGIAELWKVVGEHRAVLQRTGELESRRQEQRKHWMWLLIDERLGSMFRTHPRVQAKLARLEAEVLAGKRTPGSAAEELLRDFA